MLHAPSSVNDILATLVFAYRQWIRIFVWDVIKILFVETYFEAEFPMGDDFHAEDSVDDWDDRESFGCVCYLQLEIGHRCCIPASITSFLHSAITHILD